MDFRTRKKYYNLCNPWAPLEPGDERYVDIDAYGAKEGKRVRGVDWIEKLKQEILLSDKAVCKLYTGFPGSGKTTELLRLAKDLRECEEGNLFPVYINAEEVLDLTTPIEATDVLNSILYSIEKAIAETEGKCPDEVLNEGYHKRFWHWLTQTDVRIKQGEFVIPSVGKLVIEMKTRPDLRKQIRKAVMAHFSQFVAMVHEEIGALEEKIRSRFNREGIVVIYDSLEKLRGTSDNYDDVLLSAEKVFRGHAPYIKLPVHVVYTVPAALTTRMKQIDFIPMIKIRSKTGEPFQTGIDAARELIRKRCPDDIAEQILGKDCRKRIETLILQSGGYPREMLQYIQRSISQPEHPLTEAGFRHILQETANEYRELVTGEAVEWLAGVAKSKYLTLDNEEHRRHADFMLQNHVVMRYLNDELWFDVHPTVLQIPEIKAQLEKNSV